MANLTQNLAILQKGKQDLIDEVNSKLKESDQENLSIDCNWADINSLLDKVNVKKDHSSEIDTNEIYSDICSGELNKEIVTGVTTITDYSMYGQKYLPKITAENCTSLGSYAFYGCESLTDASFPNVTTIPSNCFYNNKSLKNINISRVTTLSDNNVFRGCSELENVSIPKIRTIGNSAFQDCTKLSLLELNKENTYSIGSNAFYNCVNLKQDVTTNASSIGKYGIYNTSILEIDGNTVTSLSSYAISNNSKLERISLPSLTKLSSNYSIDNNSALTSINLNNLKYLGTDDNTFYLISNNQKLESIYWPNITTWYGGGVYNCNKIKTLAFPLLDIDSKEIDRYEYRCTSCIAETCAELESIDLGKLSCIRQTTWTSNNYLISNCPKLKYINLSSLEYCNPTSERGSTTNYFYHCLLLNKVGIESIQLPKLKWINPKRETRMFTDCRMLKKVDLPELTVVLSAYSTDTLTNLITGCPQLTTLELQNLYFYRGSRFICGGYAADTYYNTGLVAPEYNSKKYIEKYLSAIVERYPDNYETNTDYIRYYERLHGGTINGDLTTASPFNTGYQSSSQYNLQWCGIKTIKLPKLSNWTHDTGSGYGMFKCVNELEEIYLGDGTFTPATTSLNAYFVNGATALKKVVLNYPVVLTASTSLSTIFYGCGHLTGTKYSFSYNNKTYYYENEEGLKDLYFYVPDDLVEQYKAATNWSTYADQIRGISELAGLNIDSTVTSIADREYKDNQTLTSVAGSGIASVGEEGFRGSSASSIEFVSCINVGNYAFADCQNLTRIQLGYSRITTVNTGVFMNSQVSFCTLPICTEIKANAFKNTEVAVINLPVVKQIGDSSFENDKIINANLPVTTIIGKFAFKNNKIDSLTLPEIITVNDSAFEENNLTTISFSKSTFIGNYAFRTNNITEINLPEITTIGKYAFADNNIQTVSIPKVIMIDDYAFANNTNLESINLGTVRILGLNVFDGCSGLTDITLEGYAVPTGALPENVTLHVRESMLDAFREAYPNNIIVGDIV